ncbi:MAG TPA: hypothetical protein VM713_01200 [Steroidobacteraceae bacterium]|nr:hypothetical protein [Steroidobacteraceae bacterium]
MLLAPLLLLPLIATALRSVPLLGTRGGLSAGLRGFISAWL